MKGLELSGNYFHKICLPMIEEKFSSYREVIAAGLGSAVAEVLGENYPIPMQRIGIKDILNEAGTDQELLNKFGMSHEHIIEAVKNVIARKNI